MATNKNLEIENAKFIFKTNFSGEQTQFNPAGKRNFCVVIDPELVDDLIADGWNVRHTKPRDPEEEPTAYMQVAVSYDHIPPKIVLVSGKSQTVMTEETIGSLDWAEIENVDMVIRPYNWEAQGRTGVKGYVKLMYVTIADDPFASKYYDED